MDAATPLAVELDEAGVLRGLPAEARPGHHRATLAQRFIKDDARILYRLARCQQCELREAIEQAGLAEIDVRQRIKIPHLGALRETQRGRIHGGDAGDSRAPL